MAKHLDLSTVLQFISIERLREQLYRRTFTVQFLNHTGWALHDIEAETPDKALALARKLEAEGKLDLCFEPYEIRSDVNLITVIDANGREQAWWYDDDVCLARAAHDLRDAAEFAIARLKRSDLKRGDVAEAVRILSAAVAKATGA